MSYSSLHRSTTLLLMVLFVVTPLSVASTPQRAHAQQLTHDVGLNEPTRKAKEMISFVKTSATAVSTGATAISTEALVAKEFGFDSIAYLAAQTAMSSIVRSTVNWINSGFEGSPAFATDLNRNLRQVADAQAQGFLRQLLNDNAVHSPFIDQLVVGVGTSYYLYSSRDAIRARLRYTLGDVSSDPRAFQQGDFSKGGWNAWFSTFQNPANNPYGAQMLASQLLAGQIESAAHQRITELNWGDGFLSWRGDCISSEPATDETSLNDAETCTKYEVKTPGSTIKSAFEKVGFLGIDQLINADEMNEIVSALFGQLVNKMLGSGGVSSLSQPSYAGGTSPLYRATSPGQSGSTAGITSTFSTMITRQLAQLDAYAGAWKKILAAAQGALAKCGSVDSSVQATITKATAEIAKTAESKVVLQGILSDFTRANATNGLDQTNLLLEISDRYQQASRDIVPTSVEVQNILSQAEDTGERGVPMSLYTKFTLMATKSCDLTTAGEGS